MEISWFFTNPQILREINFEDSRCTKSAISTHLASMNFYAFFMNFCTLKVCIINKIQKSKIEKKVALERLHSPKSISRKIRKTEQ